MQDEEGEVAYEKPTGTLNEGAEIFVVPTASIIFEGRPAGGIIGDASGVLSTH